MRSKNILCRAIVFMIALVMIPGALIARTADNSIPSAWAAEGVSRSISLGLVPESLQKHYTEAIRRADFCACAVRVYEIASGNTINMRKAFSDTNDVNVQKMGGLKVINGKGDGLFAPNDRLTRQEAATILSRLMEKLNIPLITKPSGFADNTDIAGWALEAVGQMQATGIMNGMGNNQFKPLEPYSIEQAIITLLKVYDLAIEVKFEEIYDVAVPLAGFFELDESSESKQLASELMDLVNAVRVNAGLQPLIAMELLNAASTIRAAECESLYSHTRPDGRRFDTVHEDLGITAAGRGENLDAGVDTAERVVQRWIGSPAHNECMMEPSWEKMGAGVHRGADGRLYWAMLFMA